MNYSTAAACELDWLSRAGIAIMKDNQDPSGAFLASPTFPVYRYSWLRDGAFIATALSRAGERTAAGAFHQWTANTIGAAGGRVDAIVQAHRDVQDIDQKLLLPARYLASGAVEDDDSWPTIQFDGYGTWLWALAAYQGDNDLPAAQERAVRLAADYLSAVWTLPCYDYWEEFGDRQHTSTLAAITAGLRAAAALTGVDRYARAADDVWSFVLAQCLAEGHFIKGPEDRRVDASLLSLAVPFGLVEVGDERFASTVRRIEAELAAPSGGVWRYLGDTYYGGGAWVLLTCWLAWAQLEAGNTSKASAGLQWVRHWASVDGQLPEQVTDGGHVQQPAWRQPWVDKWGQPANPLLWSQAMYVLLDDALGRARQGGAA